VPVYAYSCRSCGHDLEARQSFDDPALTVCPECAGELRKVFTSVGVVFKGSGFYRTDSRDEPGKKRDEPGKKKDTPDSAPKTTADGSSTPATPTPTPTAESSSSPPKTPTPSPSTETPTAA